jgi:heterodisulfide reductase subunit B
MKYALFLGCTIPARSRNYEIAARNVAKKLGLELIDLPDFSCCGFPMKSLDRRAANLLAARNLALAEEHDLSICTLCSACTAMVAEEIQELNRDLELREKVNQQLAKVGRHYKGSVKVKHFAHVLLEDIGLDSIRGAVTVDLKGLKVALHYGCHYLKPSRIYPGGENPEAPTSLERLTNAVGVKSVCYERKMDCCGGSLMVTDENTGLTMAKEKLDRIRAAGARAIGLVCPFCSVMYDDNQKSIETQFGVNYQIPVLFLPQILGLAMGLSRRELGLNMNVVNTKNLTEEILG